jgi:hypothetical protein
MDGGIFNNGIQMPVQLQKVNEPVNWQQVRIQAAVKLTCALSEKMLGAGYSERQIAKQAVELADALVAELQKRGGNNGKSN